VLQMYIIISETRMLYIMKLVKNKCIDPDQGEIVACQ